MTEFIGGAWLHATALLSIFGGFCWAAASVILTRSRTEGVLERAGMFAFGLLLVWRAYSIWRTGVATPSGLATSAGIAAIGVVIVLRVWRDHARGRL